METPDLGVTHNRNTTPKRAERPIHAFIRDAAEVKGQELMKKYADHFKHRTNIEISLYPEVEWREWRGQTLSR